MYAYVHLNTLQYLLSIDVDRDVVEVGKSVHKLNGSWDVDRCIIVQCLWWKYMYMYICTHKYSTKIQKKLL